MDEKLMTSRKKLVWVVGMILCLLAGGWIGWKVWIGSGPKTGEKFVINGVDNTQAAGERPRPIIRPARVWKWMDGVNEVRKSQWRVQSAGVIMLVRQGGGKMDFSFVYPNSDVVATGWREIQQLRTKVVWNRYGATAIGISEEQIEKLKEMSGGAGWLTMEVKAEDQERIKAMWAKYAGAPAAKKAEIEKNMVKMLGEIGKSSLEGTKQVTEERIRQIRAILTPEQWERVKQMPAKALTVQKVIAPPHGTGASVE